MKKILLTGTAIILTLCAYTQGIGMGTLSPNASAQLDITHTSKGILIPRMSSASVASIINPAKGLLVYDSVKNQLMVNMGNAVTPNWQTIVFNSGWSLNGNTGTNAASQFIGTIDNRTLSFRINNQYAGKLDSMGSVAFGRGALFNNPSSKVNVAMGDSALFKNGFNSLQSYYSINNTATGPKSLFNNTDGYDNTAGGYRSLYTNTSGWLNTAIGAYSGQNSNSSWAVYIGESAGYNNLGYGNVMVGSKAGYLNTSGDGNTFLGNNAGGNNVSGSSNTFVGNFAGVTNTTGNNTFIGNYSGFATSSGPANTATGSNSMYNNTIGYSNTANGNSALRSNTIGFSNTAIGAEALYSNTYATHNTATGYQALRVSNGEKNTASGSLALTANTGGSYNTAEGYAAMYLNTSGINNTASGYGALYSNSAGHYNVALGSLALYNTTTSQFNTAIGTNAGKNYDNGYNNVFVGANTDVNGAGYYNVVAIGQGTIATAVNQVRLGNASTTSFFCQGAYASTTALGANVFISSSGQFFRSTSSARYKTHINNLEINTALLHKLRPVSYNSISDSQRHFGLIAEEVAEVIPELVTYAKEKDVVKGSSSEVLIPDAVQYPLLSILVLKELQKHEQVIKEQQLLIEELRSRLVKLERKRK